jgi:hypothetical protein
MTLSELEQTPEFRELKSVKQRFFLQTYVQSLIDGIVDPVLATQSAYQTDGENARTFAYQLLRNKKIQATLRVFWNFGKSKRGIFLDDLKAEIAASLPGSVVRERLIALYGQMVFGSKSPKKQKRRNSRRTK